MAEQALLPLVGGSQANHTKRCSRCGEAKPANEFYERRRRSRVELRSECKACCIREAAAFNAVRYRTDKAYRARQIERLKSVKRDNPDYRAKRLEIDSSARKLRYKNDSEYRARIVARESAKRAARKLAAPSWLTDRHLGEIDSVYAEAARLSEETGIAHQVDHIVPIKGKNVCGLHVPWNLQILTQSENAKKGNRYDDWKIYRTRRTSIPKRM